MVQPSDGPGGLPVVRKTATVVRCPGAVYFAARVDDMIGVAAESSGPRTGLDEIL